MRTRERHGEPWRFKYGILFSLFHSVGWRLAKLFLQHEGEPAYHDSWGCPYWLYVENGHWSIFSPRRKIGDAGISIGENGELTIEDIEIHEPRDKGLGLGSFLLKQVIEYAQENGTTRIVGRVTMADLDANPKLLHWYQDFGFTLVQPTQSNDTAAAYIWMDLSS